MPTVVNGKVISFTNAPQAKIDAYSFTEDQLLSFSAFDSSTDILFFLDVMANDLGGIAKTLYSVDDGVNYISDLLKADTLTNGVSQWEAIGGGDTIRIDHGKVDIDLTSSIVALTGSTNINALSVGDQIQDTFDYAIRLSSGMLSWTSVTLIVQGSNDAPVAIADAASVKEGTNTPAQPNPVSGNVLTNDTDPDTRDTHSIAAVNGVTANVGADVAGAYGTLRLNSDGSYSYTLDNTKPAVQALTDGQQVTDVFRYTNSDNLGATSSSTLTITVYGTTETQACNRFISLNFPGASGTVADSINDRGAIVGFYWNTTEGVYNGFLYDGGTYTAFDPPGSYTTLTQSINSTGEIAGYFWDTGGEHGFLYDRGAVAPFTILDPPGRGAYDEAYEINDAGQVAGYYKDTNGVDHGFRYDGGGAYTVLDAPGSYQTIAIDLNSSGEVVGYFRDGNGQHGFLYSGGAYTILDVPTGIRGYDVLGWMAMNDAGEVVGRYRGTDGADHGFLYDGGAYTTLDPPGSSYTDASFITNNGEVAGNYRDANGQHSYLYNGGAYTTLNVPDSYRNLVEGINSTGEVVGSYDDSSGTHGFLYCGTNQILIPNGDLSLTATSGPDVFDFSSVQFGSDTITGFDPAQDSIKLSQTLAADFATVQADMSSVAGGTLMTFDASRSITLSGVSSSSLIATNFQFV
jgi:VCBS repeat-containing protein/probable HAF family extracellular repeat protein